MEKTDAMQKITEKLKGIRTAAFTTMNEKGEHVSRPMATQDMDFDGTVWFMTSADSDKAHHIEKNPDVGLSYATGDNIRFVSLSGKAEILHDEEKIKEFWNDWYKAWFEGPEDPSIRLIKVTISRAEYWDTKGGKVAAYIHMAKAAITDDQGAGEDDDENEIFEF